MIGADCAAGPSPAAFFPMTFTVYVVPFTSVERVAVLSAAVTVFDVFCVVPRNDSTL
jgi:hypothetical protein